MSVMEQSKFTKRSPAEIHDIITGSVDLREVVARLENLVKQGGVDACLWYYADCAAYAISWAYYTDRLTTPVSLWLRRLSEPELASLIAECQGLTMEQVKNLLNAKEVSQNG